MAVNRRVVLCDLDLEMAHFRERCLEGSGDAAGNVLKKIGRLPHLAVYDAIDGVVVDSVGEVVGLHSLGEIVCAAEIDNEIIAVLALGRRTPW